MTRTTWSTLSPGFQLLKKILLRLPLYLFFHWRIKTCLYAGCLGVSLAPITLLSQVKMWACCGDMSLALFTPIFAVYSVQCTHYYFYILQCIVYSVHTIICTSCRDHEERRQFHPTSSPGFVQHPNENVTQGTVKEPSGNCIDKLLSSSRDSSNSKV